MSDSKNSLILYNSTSLYNAASSMKNAVPRGSEMIVFCIFLGKVWKMRSPPLDIEEYPGREDISE